METATLVGVVVVALFFDFTNGFHDTANSIATSVSTRALSPRMAVVTAAVLNFAGAFVSLEVAATVAKGIVIPEVITLEVVLAGLIGAITWNLITWYLGLPSSSSHALIGGVAGSAIAAGGFGVVQWHGLVEKVAIPSLLAPVLGVGLAAAVMVVLLWLIRRRAPGTVNRVFRRLQLVSGGFVAFTHGTNDAQKTMGIIALALVATGHLDAERFDVPLWVIVSAALAMAAGTYAGGWRIIRTLGQRVAKLDPPQGFAAQTATATILWFTGTIGFPVSTTHTITGSVLGAGATRRLSAVRWGVAGSILVAWLITIPSAALVGAAMEGLTRLPGGTAIVLVVLAGIAGAAFAARRTQARRSRASEHRPALPSARGARDEGTSSLVSPPG
jgi:inorganic phosphate transporter, PiT family